MAGEDFLRLVLMLNGRVSEPAVFIWPHTSVRARLVGLINFVEIPNSLMVVFTFTLAMLSRRP